MTFVDDSDYRLFRGILRRVVTQEGAQLLAYCLMPNHFHLAIKVGQTALSHIMQRLLTAYVGAFNHRQDRTGHLFQARYKASLCLDNAYLRKLIPYIHLNPVRAKLVRTVGDWRWSSFRDWRQSGRDADFASEAELLDFDPWPQPADASALLRAEAKTPKPLEEIAAAIVEANRITLEQLRSNRRQADLVDARYSFVRAAISEGHRRGQVESYLHVSSMTISRALCGLTAEERAGDVEMR